MQTSGSTGEQKPLPPTLFSFSHFLRFPSLLPSWLSCFISSLSLRFSVPSRLRCPSPDRAAAGSTGCCRVGWGRTSPQGRSMSINTSSAWKRDQVLPSWLLFLTLSQGWRLERWTCPLKPPKAGSRRGRGHGRGSRAKSNPSERPSPSPGHAAARGFSLDYCFSVILINTCVFGNTTPTTNCWAVAGRVAQSCGGEELRAVGCEHPLRLRMRHCRQRGRGRGR